MSFDCLVYKSDKTYLDGKLIKVFDNIATVDKLIADGYNVDYIDMFMDFLMLYGTDILGENNGQK